MEQQKRRPGRQPRCEEHSTVQFNFKVTPEEAKQIEKDAAKEFSGNVAAFCRAKVLGKKDENGS